MEPSAVEEGLDLGALFDILVQHLSHLTRLSGHALRENLRLRIWVSGFDMFVQHLSHLTRMSDDALREASGFWVFGFGGQGLGIGIWRLRSGLRV